MILNQNYRQLQDSYLFAEIARRVAAYKEAHPDADIIRLGIGDVTRPLSPAVIAAMTEAVAEMGTREGFQGYGPYEGYDFLREAIGGYYGEKGVALDIAEIFVSDGAKSDMGNIGDLFGADCTVLIPDPVYPVYVDTNLMAGRKIVFLNGDASNHFLPMPDQSVRADIIYLCSPNNPTGAVYTREALREWVDYAQKNGAVILFDVAYEAYVRDKSLPRSIYEIEGARECAIEFSSLSKTAGFTGTRCGYTVVPKALVRDGMSLNDMWLRRQSTKYNGVPYIIQRGAAAVFSPQGRKESAEHVDYYMGNAEIIADSLRRLGISFTGGENSPYIWLACPEGMSSWEYFDYLLNELQVVGTPGAGFGGNGEGFFRLTCFGDREATRRAMERIAGAAR